MDLDGADEMIERFRHEAMNTTFDVAIAGVVRDEARHAARAVFDGIDRLERILSRFLPGSDVWQINAMREGDCLRVRPETIECLEIAAECAARTNGAFDVGLGAMMDALRDESGAATRTVDAADARDLIRERALGSFVIDRERLEVSCARAGMRLDLGAIGKGFALDEAAGMLREEWEIARTRLSAGTSTILALDPPADADGWVVGIATLEFPLAGSALSCSGTAQRGAHIVDPRTGRPGGNYERVWVRARTAAESDALSTGFMLMTPEEIGRVVRDSAGIEVWCSDGIGGLRHFT